MDYFLKRNTFYSLVSILLIASFLTVSIIVPTVVNAEEQSSTPCVDARLEADIRVNRFAWAIPGFLCGIFGFAIAYATEPVVPVDKIIGKSDDYVREYSLCYREAARKHQWESACVGWAIGTSVALIMISSANSTSTSSGY
ncbi:MAG: hypothetical protein HZA08_03045 [Nitrospirae bacterium]|nr:hypothetical protein [Nitrospirota bacterium]